MLSLSQHNLHCILQSNITAIDRFCLLILSGVLKLKQSVELELRVMYRKVYCVAKGKF